MAAKKPAKPVKKTGSYTPGTGGGKITKSFTAAGKRSQNTVLGRDPKTGNTIMRLKKADTAKYNPKKKP